MAKKLKGRVWYVESEKDSTVLVAMNIQIRGEFVSWFDTNKGRLMKVARVLNPSKENFVFERAPEEGGGTYTFKPMTLEIYNSKVKNGLKKPENFNKEEMMLASFEESLKEAW